ncbi:MAG: hypothetical protein U0L49_03195 [Eubacterium sp.]|nr:hypothetical protein [Eubacterium sp.]
MEENRQTIVLRQTILRVCFDIFSKEENKAEGRIYGISLKEAKNFSSPDELLLRLDQVMDEIGAPQASRETRSFEGSKEPQARVKNSMEIPTMHSNEEILAEKGRTKTVNLLFQSRYYSSWQGIMMDDTGRNLGEFKSDLELLGLLGISI